MPAPGMVHAYAAMRTREGRSRWDEMVGFSGRVRRGWRDLQSAAEALGPAGLSAAAAEAGRLLAEEGVTHRPARAAGEQTWSVDPLPLFLDEGEWAALETALAQRAELLDRLLADLYGPRETLRVGLLPVEIVHAHPGFLRAWHGVVPAGVRQLFLAGADLARGDDGAWCVLADRVQAATGPGYAMANRRVVSRVLPVLHRQSEIHRVGPFFGAMRLGLELLAPPMAESPRAVLLTAGPDSETAFEQAFLSSLLGCPLVRGEDLVVADGRVWQHALGRLEPVDVILRRLDGVLCDPLDLQPDSELGVPGLIEAARAGTVRVVNGLGSGVLENPALAQFLPGLARHLLDEPLRLRSVPTWWCGHREGRAEVLARLAELELCELGEGGAVINGATLDSTEVAAARARIEADPHAWVGREIPPGSTAPGVVSDGLAPREVVLRTFAVATGRGYQVMAGGLARLGEPGPGEQTPDLLTPGQAITKDVWIRNTRGAPAAPPWVREATPSQVAPITVSPRVSESMFWLGRYVERAEDTARLLRAVADRWADFHSSPETPGAGALGTLLTALTQVTRTWPGFAGDTPTATPAAELTSLLLDDTREGTLAFAVRRLTALAGDVREQLSTDTWLVLGSLGRELARLRLAARTSHGPRGIAVDARPATARVLEGLLALSGLMAESLVRDTAWRFCELGRRIERAQHVSALLAATLTEEREPDADSLVVESVLIAAESIITYRRRYQARAGVATVLDLLLLDRENPRAVAYQLDRAGEAMDRIPAEPERLGALQEALLEIRARLRGADTGALAHADSGGHRVELRDLLAATSTGLTDWAADLDRGFFIHPAPQRRLTLGGR